MSTSLHPLDHRLLLGRYRVVRLLGEGGMGTVHLARVEGAEGFTRPVVVKRMKRDLRSTEEGNRLFIREAKILSKMQHPSIVGISDFGIDDGVPTMVLEYVHGYTLSPWLLYRVERKLPIPVDACLFVVRRILDALHYAHRFNTEEGNELEIVHRDVSPDNVLVSNRGYVHLLDFGIASIRGPRAKAATQTGGFRGKLSYSAPETVMGETATPRSDQYSAAVVLLEMLTGVTPFQAPSVAETFLKMVSDVPELASKTRPDIPTGLDGVIGAALAKDPLQRFESAHAFARELRRFQSCDDDEVAEQLRDLVQRDFEDMPRLVNVEPLRDRQAALDKATSIAPAQAAATAGGGLSGASPSGGTEAALVGDGSRVNTGNAATILGTSTVVVPSTTAPSRQLQGLLWGVIAVGGLIAVGLGATVAVLSRGSNANVDQQVVVVGGGRDDQNSAGARDAEHTAAPPPLTGPSGSGEALAPTSASRMADPNAPPALESGPKDSRAEGNGNSRGATAGTGQAQLAAAVQQKSGSFQSCFVQHLGDSPRVPEAVLHFDVAKTGGAAHIDVEPPAVANSGLGVCLKRAGASVRFPPLQQPVSFRVPVRARVTHTAAK